MINVLGISAYFHDSAAALLCDGKLVAAAEEERFSRIKHDYGFPEKAIDFCLTEANISIDDIDYVVFFEKPFLKFERLLRTTFSTWPSSWSLFRQSMRNWLLDKLWVKSTIKQTLGLPKDRILFSEHHLSHAASAFFCSPFEEAAVVTLDGVGEWATLTIGYGSKNRVTLTQEMRFPHSIGLLYSVFTAFLGFEVNEGEYKVMGMAPYGEPRYVEKIREMVEVFDDGSFRLKPEYFAFIHGTRVPYSKRFLSLFGPPRNPDSSFFTTTSEYPAYYGAKSEDYETECKINQYYADVAASIQVVTEELILGVVKRAHDLTGSKNLCIAGGVGLNSVANGRIAKETAFDGLFIQPSAGDGGGALGAALFAWHQLLDQPRSFVMDHALWGASYDENRTRHALAEFGLDAIWVKDDDELVNQTAKRISEGKTIGWFQGRFEFGPRALGNRSILADPRNPETKDRVNVQIKFREPFRPFAPAVVAECADEFFDMPNDSASYPAAFMLLVVPVREEKRPLIPAVSHMGTARVQTVNEQTNPLYYRLIKRFGEITGVPIILNTSFNVKGEVIVDTPEQAVQTFINSGLDTLVIGRAMVDKN